MQQHVKFQDIFSLKYIMTMFFFLLFFFFFSIFQGWSDVWSVDLIVIVHHCCPHHHLSDVSHLLHQRLITTDMEKQIWSTASYGSAAKTCPGVRHQLSAQWNRENCFTGLGRGWIWCSQLCRSFYTGSHHLCTKTLQIRKLK